MKTCILLLCLYLLSSLGNLAMAEDIAYPIITVTCDDANDVLKIKNEVKWNEAGKNFPFSEQDGTYNPWDWVKISVLKDTQTLIPQKELELSCQLSNNLYKIVLKPKIFNHNYTAKCGNRLSAIVTVFRGGSILVEDKALEEFCLGNSPVIRGIKVFGKSGQVKYYRIARHKFF
jgi:hypothetical protein